MNQLEVLAGQVAALRERLAELEARDEPVLRVVTDDVSNPPTDVELDAVFGTAAAVGTGFVGVVDDNGAGANVYLVVSDGSNWWYEELTAVPVL